MKNIDKIQFAAQFASLFDRFAGVSGLQARERIAQYQRLRKLEKMRFWDYFADAAPADRDGAIQHFKKVYMRSLFRPWPREKCK